MFEQTSRLAEKLAARVSRRGFLGSLGGWAAATAMGVAGMLIGAGTARAGQPCAGNKVCCRYYGNGGLCTGALALKTSCSRCPLSLNGCPFLNCFKLNSGPNGCNCAP
jgi:hypothetical protein